MISDEILLHNFSLNMKPSTLKSYSYRIAVLKKLFADAPLYKIITDKKSYNVLKSHTGSENASLANYITVIAKLFSSNKELKGDTMYDFWRNHLKQEKIAELDRYKENKPTEKQNANLIEYETVFQKFKVLNDDPVVFHDKKNNLQFLLLACLLNIRPKRADFGNVRIVGEEDIDIYKDNDKDKENYIVLSESEPKLVLNVYKTAKKHSTITEEINPVLYKIIKSSLEFYPRKYLFVDKEGKPYIKNNSYSQFVIRTFKSLFNINVGVSIWRHIYVSNKLNPTVMTTKELEREAFLMGHTIAQQSVVYRWVKGNETCECKCV